MAQISNKFLAQAPTLTLKGNNTGATANVADLTVSQVQLMLGVPTSSAPLAITSGGTGQTTAAAAFNALNPMTTTGDLIYESATGVASRLAIGSTNQVLTVIAGVPSWQTPASGSVTAVSVATANGLAGTSSGGATPTLTLSTTITGILKGNGTAISAAVSGTDYVVPSGSITGSAGSVSGTNVVTNTNLAQMPTLTIKGNNTGSTANAADLTVAQVNAILPVFTSSLNGLVPASGGGTTNFLRADGTFAVPTGTVGANTTLSNLTSPTAINQALLPATSNSYNMGSSSAAWNNLYIGGILAPSAVRMSISTASGTSSTGISMSSGLASAGASGTIAISTGAVSTSGYSSGNITLTTGAASGGATQGTITLSAAAISASGSQINNVADPTSAQDAATKNYVDNAVAGLTWKNAVVVTSTSNITLSGEQTIDGVLTSSSRVLVQGQSTGSQNGIYVSGSGAWTRSSDAQVGSSFAGVAVFVELGTTNANTAWVQTTDPATVGTTSLTFVKFSAGTSVTYGNGLQVISNVVSVEAANTTLTVASGGVSVNLNAAGAITNSSGLLVKTDGVTTKINASNQVEGQNGFQDNLTLTNTDITNQYKDLSYTAAGATSGANSVVLSVAGGPIQLKGTDYTVSLTGGVGGVTRITFTGALATGGISALVAGDILMVSYNYLP